MMPMPAGGRTASIPSDPRQRGPATPTAPGTPEDSHSPTPISGTPMIGARNTLLPAQSEQFQPSRPFSQIGMPGIRTQYSQL